jgi:RHS repeat-associated protein
LLTLRDASGQVVADFKESNASDGLKLQREHVRANGQLVAINSTCGPRPALKLSNPATDGWNVWFDKTDYVGAVGGYTLHIRTSTGQTKTIVLPWNLAHHFSIAQSELFPNVQNWIQIEAEAECGSTGYSNAVTFAYDPNSPSCLKSIGGARIEFSGSGSKLAVRGQGSCTPTTTYNVYYSDPDAEEQNLAPLNGSTPVADPSQILENLPCGSGNGNYWIRPVSSVTHHEMASSPVMTVDGSSCGGETNAIPAFIPGQPGMNVQYVHWDHLGSTRMLTDERGVPIAKFKYFPFGYESEFTGGDDIRQKFTGHERDDRVGLDYMMARSCRMALGRFLEPDPYDGSISISAPQSWNRYAYVSNNPVNAIDPSGYAGALVTALCATNGSCGAPGGTPQDSVGGELRSLGSGLESSSAHVTQYATVVRSDGSVAGVIALAGGSTYDSSKTGPADPTNPTQPLHMNPIVIKAGDEAFMKTMNGTARGGLAEAGFSIQNKPSGITIAYKVDTVHSSGPPNKLALTTDNFTIALYHTHGNKAKAVPSADDMLSSKPNFVRSQSHLYVTVPNTRTIIQLY